MRIARGFRKLLWLTLAVSFALVVPALAQDVLAPTTLANTDCIKCHERQPLEIAEKGAAHKTEIGCQDCHTGHRPKVANNIPACSLCHSGEKHFELKDCTSCHNPHQPLEVVLKGDLKAPCLTCHEDQGQMLVANPSKHETFACTFCHAQKHGVIPECVQCHKPHSDKMAQADCKACHQAHKPLALNYGPQTPSVFCAACHDDVYLQLQASKTKHAALDCAFCHQNKHKTVPQCSDCHGLPHPETMHQKFPVCGQCHNTAHDLNNWPSQKEAGKKPNAPGKDLKKGTK